MINSPWQADDDADNQSGDNRGDLAHTSISDRSASPLWIFAIRLSALCSNWPQSSPAVKPRYCCNGRLPDGYHQWSIIGKAPRLNLQCQRPDFSERSSAKLLAVGIPPTGKKQRPAPVDLSFGFSVTAYEVIGVTENSLRLQWRHNHDFGFLDVRYSVPPTTLCISRNAYVDYWFLPSSTPASLAAKVLISEPIESVPM